MITTDTHTAVPPHIAARSHAMSASVPSGDGGGMIACIDPRLTLLDLGGAVSTHDLGDNDGWSLVEDGGSARSPSVVPSPWTPSTDSSSSWYAGSAAGSPNDVDFSPPGLEPHSLVVSQNPTGLSVPPGDTMHDIAAAQHGVFTETPGPWNMAMPANELAALQDTNYANIYDQAQLNMDQVYDFNTMPSIPNPPAFMMQSNGNPSSET